MSARLLHDFQRRILERERRFSAATLAQTCIRKIVSCTPRIAPSISISANFPRTTIILDRCLTMRRAIIHPGWTSRGDPWALVTVSSLKQDDIAIVQAALAGLSTLPLRVLVTAGPHAIQVLGPLPRNARLEQYVQHGPVLTKARLMISHAGHGSVMRALWHGVPMVLIPWGRDQGGVAAGATHLGVTEVVAKADISAERVADAARSALDDDKMAARIAAVSLRLRAMNPVNVACGLVERL
jgi:UDP:flavonoid glycosyltransferase YjiC (YdhE family)